jgi:Spy/CpxP family protein refolding chaperone
MKTKTIKMLILTTALSVTGASYAVAATNQDNTTNTQDCTMMQEDSHEKYHGRKKSKNMGFEKLNLSEQQKQQMKSITTASKKQRENEKLAHQTEMQAFMQASTFNEKVAKTLIEKQQSDQVTRKISKLKRNYQMYQILTDEQKKQYNEQAMKRNKR